jgi:hypothetical protein
MRNAAAVRLPAPLSLVHAGERVGFIPVPHFVMLQRKAYRSKTFRDP